MRDFIAYKGPKFTIEWYFDENGFSESLEYFNEMGLPQKRKILMLFKRIGDFGRISDITKFRNEGDQIFAFKPQPDRLLSFFYTGKKIIVTNGYLKKSQKLPKREKDKVLKIMLDYDERVKKGKYYV